MKDYKISYNGDAYVENIHHIGVEYLDNILDKEAVFVNKNGTRTTERNIKQVFENYGNGITPHMMRHYYASIMNRNGNLAFVQQQLGHSSVNTTVNNYANGAVGMREKLMEM